MDSNLETVSAIITTHNRCHLLQKAIQSVLAQTYICKDLIIVDDNSTDETAEYLQELVKTESAISYIHIDAGESKGGNYARNRGVLAAQGDYIAFLDDDDEWMPQKIEKQMKIFQNDPDVGLVYCGGYREFDFGRKKIIPVNKEFTGDISEICFKGIFCTTSSIMVRKSLMYDSGMFDEKLKFWQEYDLIIRLAKITKAAAVDEPLYLLREISSDPSRLTNKLDGWMEAVRYIEKKYRGRIDKLPIEINLNREATICYDGIMRCKKAGNRVKEQEFKIRKKELLFQLWKLKKTPKYLAKYILNH
jgi:glycosyltransferase involved in cell wall biosynthesis